VQTHFGDVIFKTVIPPQRAPQRSAESRQADPRIRNRTASERPPTKRWRASSSKYQGANPPHSVESHHFHVPRTSPHEPATDPLPLYRYRDGIVSADLLGAAIAHLDFFTWLADHRPRSARSAAHFETSLATHGRDAHALHRDGLLTKAGGL